MLLKPLSLIGLSTDLNLAKFGETNSARGHQISESSHFQPETMLVSGGRVLLNRIKGLVRSSKKARERQLQRFLDYPWDAFGTPCGSFCLRGCLGAQGERLVLDAVAGISISKTGRRAQVYLTDSVFLSRRFRRRTVDSFSSVVRLLSLRFVITNVRALCNRDRVVSKAQLLSGP
jgi:hypothetical protein